MDPRMHMQVPPAVPDVAAPGWLHIADEHAIAIGALLVLPLVLVMAVALVQALAGHSRLLARLSDGIASTSPAGLLAVLLMLVAAAIHLVLIPGHLEEDPIRAALFAVNGVAFITASIALLATGRWLRAAAALGLLTIATYAFYVVTGREDMDLIGLFTKAVEVGAVAILAGMIQRPTGARTSTENNTPAAQAPAIAVTGGTLEISR